MRLQAIKKRFMASKQLIIINGDDGAQWISDGANCYAVVGIRLHENYVQDVFGITDKQMDKLIIRTETRPGPLYRETTRIFGEELEEMRTIWAYEQKLYALRSADGLLYVPEDAILAACRPEDYITYQLAHDERGRLLVAICRGIFCEALLSPVPDDIADDISEKLRQVGTMPILRTDATPQSGSAGSAAQES